MKSDFDMIIKKFTSNNDIIIYPISDVHLGAAEHMRQEWEEFCASVLKEKNAYLVLGGDLLNNSTRSSIGSVFDEVLRPKTQKRVMAEMLAPLRDRILCSVSGNHERRSGKDADDDPSYDIMSKLDLEDLYRENIAFIKIMIGNTNDSGLKNPSYMLAITHGSGGGILTGAAVNRNERFGYIIDGLDCLIVGHTHKPFITQPQKIVIDKHNNLISFKPFKVVSSTSWVGYSGYPVQKMMLPSSHALQTIRLHGRKKQIDVTM